jgi:hypothetical protein
MSMKVHPSECPYCGQQPADCMCNFDPPRYLRMIPPNTNLRKKDLQLRILISGTSQPPVAALIRTLRGALGRRRGVEGCGAPSILLEPAIPMQRVK